MTILVTAASGQLGRLVLDALLARGTEPGTIRAGARRPETLDAYAAKGIDVVRLDYADAGSVKAAVDGADRVLLISGSEVGQRVDQHRTVVDAAAAAGVDLLVYTSAPHATTADFVLAPEHKATEEIVAASGVPATILRNNWYHENYADALATARDTGVVITSAGAGRVASAARADYADAAAAVLLGEGHAGQVYELAGDVAWTFDDLAAAMGEVLGREVTVERLSPEEHVARLESFGLDAGTAGFVAGIDAGIRAGVLAEPDGSLARVTGHPTTPLVEGLRALL